MNIRNLIVTDEQIALIETALSDYMVRLLKEERDVGPGSKYEMVDLLHACAKATLKEPPNDNMIHGWAL